MTAMTVELSRADQDILRRAPEVGGFEGPQDVLHQALTLLNQSMACSEAVQLKLHEKLQEGTRSGDPVPVDENYWSGLRAELQARRDSPR